MPTPPKPYIVLTNENKSHRTKKELEQRKNGEAALLTGSNLTERPEVKNNRIAHKEFLRINKLLSSIGKNDAIYEGVINRYCLLSAECLECEKKQAEFYESKLELQQEYRKQKIVENDDGTVRYSLTPSEYYKLLSNMQKNIIGLDKQLQAKRKMLFDIERENVMTIASALRSIPKKEEKQQSALLAALGNG